MIKEETSSSLLTEVRKMLRSPLDRMMRAPHGFDQAVPHKGGRNDLSRWKQFGGDLDRPAAPGPMRRAIDKASS